jgi:biopolymer transport protein ExbD
MKRALLLFVVAACVDSGSGPAGKKIDPNYVQQHTLRAVPPNVERWDVPLGDSVIYIGNTIDRPRATPGQPITVTHYWTVVKPIVGTWKPFAIVRGPAGGEDFMNLSPTDMEIARPPSTWKPGEIIEDLQTFTMRPDWHAAGATLLVGLIEQGGHGSLDRMFTTGPHTQDRAIVARQLEVDLSRAVRPGTIHIPRASGPITVDGLANELPWTTAVASPEFATAEGSGEPVGKATAKMLWDDTNLYVFIQITDSDIVSPYKKHDEPLWKADCVEMFIDADGNGRGYVELQANPNGVTFDSWFPGGRAPKGDEAWDSNMVAAVKLRGTTEPGDTDTGWDVELAIPWAAVKGRDDKMMVNTPPKVGDRWRLNVVRPDYKTNGKDVTVASWNRITISDFHALDRMLTGIFADPSGSIVPTPEAPPQQQQQTPPPPTVVPVPTSDASPPPPAEPPLLALEIDGTGAVLYAGNKLSDPDLDKVLRVIAARDKNAKVIVRAAKTAPQARVIGVVDRAKQAGLANIQLSVAN